MCPTPIGNLEDITLRVLRTLREADLIACEDTRRTAALLSHFDIHKPTVSLHAHNERQRAQEIVRRVREGQRVALVSDAGTPLLADPGQLLVRQALAEGLRVVVLPGPSAVTTALVGSGLPPVPFAFVGFLPRARRERTRLLARYLQWPCTLVAFEVPHRLADTLQDLAQLVGEERRVVVARELTKLHEEYRAGTARELLAGLPDEVRGECVLVIQGATEQEGSVPPPREEVARVCAELPPDLPPRAAARWVAERTGISAREAYRYLMSRAREESGEAAGEGGGVQQEPPSSGDD